MQDFIYVALQDPKKSKKRRQIAHKKGFFLSRLKIFVGKIHTWTAFFRKNRNIVTKHNKIEIESNDKNCYNSIIKKTRYCFQRRKSI